MMKRTSLLMAAGLVLGAGAAFAQESQLTGKLAPFNDSLGPQVSDFKAQLTNDPSFNTTYGTDNGRPAVVSTAPNTNVSQSAGTFNTAFLASNLIGRPVADSSGQNIGEVQDLLISGNNQLDGVVLDVGNALGMGAKRVAVGINSVQATGDGSGPLVTSVSREQFSSAPDFSQQPMILR